MYYTSYFGNIKKIDKTKYQLAAISNEKPSFCDESVLDWSFLGPWKQLLSDYKNNIISEEEYARLYTENLEAIWPSLERWFMMNERRNIVMLCYEAKGKFCHRHILSKFLNEHGFECKEL